jgi:hypothetical protein
MDIEAIKQGEGPVAEQLRARDRVRNLENNWKFAKNFGELKREPLGPSAEELIQFSLPWKASSSEPALTEDELLDLVAPYYCFVKRYSGFGLKRESRSREYIALKAPPELVDAGIVISGFRAQYSKPQLSITLEEPSGSSVRICINPSKFEYGHGWYTVEIFNILEHVTYPGTIADVRKDVFRDRLLDLMEKAGWDWKKYLDNTWVMAHGEGQLYEKFTEAHQQLIKVMPTFRMPKTGYAFEYLMQQFDREGCAYAEYVEEGEVRWVFISKFYETGGQSRFFHGKVGDPQIEVLKLHRDHFGDHPKDIWRISQNMNNSLAQFDPIAFTQFFRLFSLGRQIFVSHQSDD